MIIKSKEPKSLCFLVLVRFRFRFVVSHRLLLLLLGIIVVVECVLLPVSGGNKDKNLGLRHSTFNSQQCTLFYALPELRWVGSLLEIPNNGDKVLVGRIHCFDNFLGRRIVAILDHVLAAVHDLH